MSKNKKVYLPHYWICSKCAKKKGGKLAAGICTCSEGPCPYCGVTGTITPIVDFDWKDKSKKHFKYLRD